MGITQPAQEVPEKHMDDFFKEVSLIKVHFCSLELPSVLQVTWLSAAKLLSLNLSRFHEQDACAQFASCMVPCLVSAASVSDDQSSLYGRPGQDDHENKDKLANGLSKRDLLTHAGHSANDTQKPADPPRSS